jgi:hypothetical protein
MMNDVFMHMSEQLTAKIDAIKEDLAAGRAADYGEYKYSCGVYRGLLLANDVLLTTKERMENSDE